MYKKNIVVDLYKASWLPSPLKSPMARSNSSKSTSVVNVGPVFEDSMTHASSFGVSLAMVLFSGEPDRS